MKKTILLLTVFLSLSLVFVQAQIQFIHISGYVTDELNGNAVPNHEVYIMDQDSLGIFRVTTTNINGFYVDTIPIGGMVPNSLYVYTYDLCTFGIHDTLIQNPGSMVTADFEICVELNIICQANFYYTTDSNAMTGTVYFWDLSYPVGMIDTWFWEFGDGTSSTEQNPVYTYAGSGTYQVCLTISADSSQCTSVYCAPVDITINDQFQLGGNVFAGIYQLDQGFAYAFKAENGVITDVFSDFIDTLGYYLFYPMVAADYYVRVEPSPNSAYHNDYIPTYYGDVVTWEDAVLINLDQNIYTADINLVPINQASSGQGQISGTIVHGNTLRDNTPAEGVQIMLANEAGEFVGLVYSDEEGIFSFDNLPFGIFNLYAEVTGINMVPGEFVLTEANSQIGDISMIMTDYEIYFSPTGIEVLDDVTVSEIYPNPVSDILKLDIGTTDPTFVTVRIFNQLGQVIGLQQISLQQGKTVEISLAGLQQGIYFLEVVTASNFRAARRFIKL